MTDIDSFLDAVAREVAKQLDEVGPDASRPKHWVVMQDKKGVQLSIIERGEPHELLSSY
jgi:hypothetical protein